MADLSNPVMLRFRNPALITREEWTLDNSAAQTVYRGSPIIIDGSADTVYGRIYIDAVTLVNAVDVFLGIADEGAVVATGDVETSNKIVLITGGEVGFKNHSLTDADVGKTATMADSGTIGVAAEAAGALAIGRVTRVEDGWVFVRLDTPRIASF